MDQLELLLAPYCVSQTRPATPATPITPSVSPEEPRTGKHRRAETADVDAPGTATTYIRAGCRRAADPESLPVQAR